MSETGLVKMNLGSKKLFGSPPKINTFQKIESTEKLQRSGRSNASALPRQLMGLNINMQAEM